MNPIKLVTDSTCDLSKELISTHDISVVPLFVNFGEESFLDGVTLNPSTMYEMVEQRGILPKTAAASPGMFVEVFEEYLNQGYDILYLGIGSKFSATYQSAKVAKETIQSSKVFLVDSQNLSSGSGLLLLKAAKMRQMGQDIETIVRELQFMIPKIRTQFVISTMEYLHKGGRCSSIAALFGTLLKIKPIIKVVNGAMEVGKKPRGPIQIAVNVLMEEAIIQKDSIDPDFLMITHSVADEAAQYASIQLHQELQVDSIYETSAGCVISSHCGQGCIGVIYLLK
ncbi:MAG: DegV family protein [Candidatus Izemoplasmatales bacterium]|nr:DegV family protein [bacterium]MDZ4196339.1 DegV family protein [Candidatus Izemoplasmatales bacterium]